MPVVQLVGALLFGVPGTVGGVVLMRGWRDRPVDQTLGLLAACLAFGGLGWSGLVALADQGTGSVVFLIGVAGALLCCIGWAVTRCHAWLVGLRLRRMAAEQGRPIPRGRLSVAVLVVLYAVGAVVSMLLTIGVAIAVPGVQVVSAGVPVVLALPGALVVIVGTFHIVLHEFRPFIRG